MEIKDFIKQTGKFLKAEDVIKSKQKLFVITGESTMAHNDKFNVDKLHVPGQLDENEFILDCSKTNARTLAATLGTDTKKWVGTVIVLETYKTKTTEGKMVDAINIAKIQM